MKKYFFNDGTSQHGPFTIEELGEKNITAETPVWYDGLPDWTTAGKVDELKAILVHTPPPFHATTATQVEPASPVTPVAITEVKATEKAAPVMAVPAPAKPSKKNTAWLSYVLALMVFGGVGYFIYQDMEKNKETGTGMNPGIQVADSTASTIIQQPATEDHSSTIVTTGDTAKTNETIPATTEPVLTDTVIVEPVDKTPATTTTSTPATIISQSKSNSEAANKAKQEEAKKLALKKVEEDKKKRLALQASAAKEMDYRNNWSRYITIGKVDFNTSDGVQPFDVPVYNATNSILDNVTIRIDYMRKEKKVLNSESVTILNIPPGNGKIGKASGSRKGNNVKVTITGVSSKKLHFCYPSGSGKAGDPFYCN